MGGSAAYIFRHLARDLFGPLGYAIFDLIQAFRLFKRATDAATTTQYAQAAANVRVMGATANMASAAAGAGPIVTPYTPGGGGGSPYGGQLPPFPNYPRLPPPAGGKGQLVEYQGSQLGPVIRSGLPATTGQGAAAAGGGGGIGLGTIALGAGVALAGVYVNKIVREMISGGIGGLGNLYTAAISANPNPAATIGAAGGGIEAFGKSLPPVLGGMEYFVIALGAATKALGGLMEAVDANVERYAQFSPQLAFAGGISEMRQTLGDFRRAQEVGPALAGYVNARADLQQKIEDTKARLMVQIAPLLITGMKIIEAHLPAIETGLTIGLAPLTALNSILIYLGIIKDNVTQPDVDLQMPSLELLQGRPFFEGAAGGGKDKVAMNIEGLR
jgi:hypothetical protein